MEFRDLKAQYQVLKPQIDKKILEVTTSGNFIMGKQVSELEATLADYVGVKHCISCANGTDALTLVLMAWGIGEGDAVFIPNFTFFSTGEVVSFENATPIFVDVDKNTFNIDVKKLEDSILKIKKDKKLRPRAIVAVDLFGQPANYKELETLSDKYDLFLLEDGAQGFGGMIESQRACSFGHAATTSFFPAKPLGCYGDGGAVFTNDDNLADLIRSYRIHGKGDHKYDNVRIGLNSRLDTIQAGILQVKFEAFINYELKAVNKVASWYNKALANVVITPMIQEGYYSSWAQYTIQLENEIQRDELKQVLKLAGIPSMVYYVKPMHMQEAFQMISSEVGECEVTEHLCKVVLALPMHPYMTEDEVLMVCGVIEEFLS